MLTYYTIVQYVPDPVADERINVGVIVFGDGQIRSRFLRNWDRVSRFALHEDISDVRDFATWVQESVLSERSEMTVTLPGISPMRRLDDESIRQIADNWSHSIQLTSPQPSLENPEVLLTRLAQSHLREPVGRPRAFRDRQSAARIAVHAVRSAISERVGATLASSVVRSGYEVSGEVVQSLRVDLAVVNGRFWLASQALSFETYDISELDKQIRDAVLTLGDIGRRRGDIQLGIVTLPPRPDQKNYQRANDRFRELPVMCHQIGASLVREEEVKEWATDLAQNVSGELASLDLNLLPA